MIKDILICGPGRNGSTSIFVLLANCKNTHVKHYCPVTRKTKTKGDFEQKNYKYRISIAPENIDMLQNSMDVKGIFLSRPKADIITSLKKFGDKINGKPIEQYVEEYIDKAKALEGVNFRTFDVSFLDSREGQKEIFEHLEIDEEDRRYMRSHHYNKS